jgi:polysaccharide pyruvyl transferase WcaK-like protein
MSWRQDAYWVAASDAAMAASREAELVLVPSEFLELNERFVPLEYSWGLEPRGRKIAWCCSKDDAHRLAPWIHSGHADRRSCSWANEVFVLCSNFVALRKASSTSIRHWQAWRELSALYLSGRSIRETAFRPAPGALTGSGPKVLVVGASGMGNIGDDLLSVVLADLLRRHAGARVWWSNSDVDPLHLKGFRAVVIGGGGLIYASRDGRNETQNLANYLKFGPICRDLGLPVAMFGVSDQDHAGGLDRDEATREFVRTCLPLFERATTRDEDSANLLRRLGVLDVQAGPDLLFAWAGRARRAIRAKQPLPGRVAMAGELLDNIFVGRGVRDTNSAFAKSLAGQEVDLLIMSDDDVSHAQRIRPLLVQCGASVSIQDTRGRGFDALVHAFAQYRVLISTRFHGLVMALLCQVPVLALDGPNGKKSRLLRQMSEDEVHLLSGDTDVAEGFNRLAGAVAGQLTDIPKASVTALAQTMTVHFDAVAAFAEPWKTATHRSDIDASSEVMGETVVAPLPPRPGVHQRYRTSDLLRNPSDSGGSVALCWAASTRETNHFGNLGDSLSAVMVSALSGRRVHHVGFERPETKLVAVGSIAHAIRGGEAVIWGSGVSIRGGVLAQSVPQTHYDVRSLRGPISARHLRDLGITVPDVYGDPVWLLPSIFNEPIEKRYELGVIPHIQDIDGFGPDAKPPDDSIRYVVSPEETGSVVLINTWHEPTWEGLLATLRLILSCKRIVSQSFHGVVIAEAYGIPVMNFRQMPGQPNGPMTVSLEEECSTDPRVWEFFRGGERPTYEMYAQRRDERTDWAQVTRAIDERWEPFKYDPTALVESFPMPVAYDPINGRLTDDSRLRRLRF